MPAPISIILPTLNAENELPDCLASLMPGLSHGLVRELVVADGGSVDATADIAEASGARLVSGPPGRAKQLINGANAARGDWLLFLHADTQLSADWAERVEEHLKNHTDKAAAFRLAFRSDATMAKRVAGRANWRARAFGLPYGDQGLLISRALYDETGGYEDVPLLEDVKLVQAVGRRRLRILSAEARTSAAKYERDGWRKRSLLNLWIMARYLSGASPETLARDYS